MLPERSGQFPPYFFYIRAGFDLPVENDFKIVFHSFSEKYSDFHIIAQLDKREVFGELSLLVDVQRIATVMAASDLDGVEPQATLGVYSAESGQCAIYAENTG